MEVALHHVAKEEKFDLPDTACEQIIKDSGGNLRKALLVLEALKMQSYVSKYFVTIVSFPHVWWF